MPDKRKSPMRLTKKSHFIIDSVMDANKQIKKTQIIEQALCEFYPQIASNYRK